MEEQTEAGERWGALPAAPRVPTRAWSLVLSLSSAGDWKLLFSFSEQHFNLFAALSPCSCIAALLLLH